MHREDEYNHLAKSTRQRGGEEQNALLRAQWEILPPPTCDLQINQRRSMTPARITIRSSGIAPSG